MMFQCSVSGINYYVVFSFHRLAFQPHVFWQYSIISKSVKYVATSTYHRDLIKENINTKLQKLNCLPRNPRVGSKLPVLFVTKPLCMGDLLPACKIFIERPEHSPHTLKLSHSHSHKALHTTETDKLINTEIAGKCPNLIE